MKPARKPARQFAFTLTELLVVVLVLGLGAAMLAPALARTQPNGKTFRCLNNHRQLVTAWRMYAEDDGDKVLNNFGASQTAAEVMAQTYRNWANNYLDWTSSSMNTNASLLDRGIMAPYVGGNIALYRCPADNFLSAPQRLLGWTARTRSSSMNAFFGPYDPNSTATLNGFFPAYRQWLKTAQVPQPANYWVFIDEQADSINDGYFLNNPTGASYWGDIPAAYHNGAASLAFADGHVEVHKWLSNTTKIPVRFSYFTPPFDALGRADYQWLITRTAVLNQ